MCGIAGFLGTDLSDSQVDGLAQMADAIRHRGPDSSGAWVDRDAGIALAHRRLAVVELSAAGAQPMQSPDGRYVLVFNGEIYDHGALRTTLEHRAGCAIAWRGSSDTETLLAAIACLGLEAALRASTGMFAFALWDRQARTLSLARDRLGEKPLYYGWHRDCFYFASELGAIRAHPAFEAAIDRDALGAYFRHGYVPAPRSILRGISKLEPGTIATVDLAGRCPHIVRFWSARACIDAGLETPFAGSYPEALDEVERRIVTAIAGQRQADVPVGAFLSGGVDSSLVTALMQRQQAGTVKTFTIGFDDPAFDESTHAARVAAHLGTEHHAVRFSMRDALELVPGIARVYDEPFADLSQIPTLLVSRVARGQVTVALSGDGGDELFGGYTRYGTVSRLLATQSRLPAALRAVLGRLASSPIAGHGPTGELRFFGRNRTGSGPLARLPRALELLTIGEPQALYRNTLSHWKRPQDVVIGATDPSMWMNEPRGWIADAPAQVSLQFADIGAYLPDCILVKVDRAAMHVSLETRVPLLDHRLFEFVWTLPPAFHAADGPRKRMLKDLLYRYVPRALVDRPKMGFGIPIAQWLRGPLRAWADDLLSAPRVARDGLLDAARIGAAWQAYLRGADHLEGPVWTALMFQSWREGLDG
ncbi:MAG: asparagine synthase (glutamine-hydrolyzing) [Lautropia sp.]